MADTSQRTVWILSASDVQRALPMADAIAAMKTAFATLSRGEVVLPPRTHLEVTKHRGDALFMPSYLPAEDRLGIKVLTLFEGNADRGLPRIQAIMLLVDGATGSPLAVMDGASLTAIRTGAASGAATDLLARPDASVVAIFGAGVQGRTQLEAVCCVRAIRQAWIVDPNAEAADRFAREMSERLHLGVRVARNAAEAVRDADIVSTATVARTPVFADADLKSGVHINAVGSYQPDVQEIPEETVARAKVVVDHRPSALAEAGDLIVPLAKGLLRESDLATELGQIVNGTAQGRTSAADITLFKSVGVAVQDVAAAARVLKRAAQLGLGTQAAL
ncbi:MAG: ornithine cyclodeaminase family protein [Pirellulales bacterium]